MSPIRPPCSSTNFFRLHEHAAAAAAGIVDARPLAGSMVRGEHLDQHLDHAPRCVELATLLAFGAGELGEEVFVDAAQRVFRAVFGRPQANRADQVDQFTEALLVECRAGVVFGQHALEARIVALDRDHRFVDQLADGGLLPIVLQMQPAGFLRHPEDVFGAVLVGVFGVGTFVIAFARDELLVHLLEGIGDVLQEDQPQHNMLILRRVHIGPQLVSSKPQLRLEAKVCTVPIPTPCRLLLSHAVPLDKIESHPQN